MSQVVHCLRSNGDMDFEDIDLAIPYLEVRHYAEYEQMYRIPAFQGLLDGLHATMHMSCCDHPLITAGASGVENGGNVCLHTCAHCLGCLLWLLCEPLWVLGSPNASYDLHISQTTTPLCCRSMRLTMASLTWT